ncbi:MAG: hypothetical protein U5M23_08580 [Marinagarivorans sp.]|nr:hypothetical protein [Marinagarivorans sp.]
MLKSLVITLGAADPNWSADVRVGQIITMLGHFIDHDRANRAYAEYAAVHRLSIDPSQRADHDFINFAEHLLAGAIGTALARVIIASTIREKEVESARWCHGDAHRCVTGN